MTGLDTNVLVRYIIRDDPAQTERADALLQEFTRKTPGFISLVALAEMFWVLRRYYRMPKVELILCLERLLDSPELSVENQATVYEAVQRFAQCKADFTDCLIERSGHRNGCRETVTFDVNAAKHAGMRLLD
jgi:predicted nucleic-acid-binding protein